MALGLTEPLTEMNARIHPRVKGGRCVGLTKLPHSYAECLEIWEPQTPWKANGIASTYVYYICSFDTVYLGECLWMFDST